MSNGYGGSPVPRGEPGATGGSGGVRAWRQGRAQSRGRDPGMRLDTAFSGSAQPTAGRFGKQDNPYLLAPRPRRCPPPTGLVGCLLLIWLRVKIMKFLISAGATLVCSIDLNFVFCKVTSGPVNSASEGFAQPRSPLRVSTVWFSRYLNMAGLTRACERGRALEIAAPALSFSSLLLPTRIPVF